METFQKLEAKVNALKEINMEAGNKLHDQLSHAQNAQWSSDDLSDLMKSDCDVADMFFGDNEVVHAEVREIQDAIIGYYGE